MRVIRTVFAVFLASAGISFGQTSPTSLMVSRVYNVTSTFRESPACDFGTIINTSTFTRRNNFHTLYASGTGSWSVGMKYSDTSCTGPWTAFGAPTSVSQADSLTIITAVGYHPFIQVLVTGSAAATYAAARDFFPGSVGIVGPAGQGVPPGGLANQVLAKSSTADFDTLWVDQTGGGSSGVRPRSGIDNPNGVLTCTTAADVYLRISNSHIFWCTATDTWADITNGAAIWGQVGGDITLQLDLTNALNGKANTGHIHAETDITNLTTDLAGKIATSARGAANGVAPLNSGGKIDTAYLPASSGLTAISQDPTPTLGGNLVLSGFSIGTVTPTEMGFVHNVTSAIQTQLNAKETVDATILRQANLAGTGVATTPARSDHNHTGVLAPLNNPAFTGTPTAPTVAQNNLSLQIANTTYVDTGLAARLPTSYLDTDATMAANSDVRIASQKASKAALDLKSPLIAPGFTAPLTLQNPTAAYEGPTLGAELVSGSGWTSTNWTGSWGAGWTHTAGNVSVLSFPVSITTGHIYQLVFTIASATAGAVGVSLGGVAGVNYGNGGLNVYGANGTYYFGPTVSGTAALTFTPAFGGLFNGTLQGISVKEITGASTPTFTAKDSSGTASVEWRIASAALANLSIGGGAGRLLTAGAVNNDFLGGGSGTNATTGWSNNGFGHASLGSLTSGWNNTGLAEAAGYKITSGYGNFCGGVDTCGFGSAGMTGYHNAATGNYSGFSLTTGFQNALNGPYSGYNLTTGSDVVAQGMLSGAYLADGTTPNTDSTQSLYLGGLTKAKQAGVIDEIVLGYNATGNGSHTATYGSSSITDHYFKGIVHVDSVSTSGTSNGAEYLPGTTSGGIAWSVANIAGTATTLLYPTDSGSAANGTVLTIGGTVTCPTGLPSFAPATCRSTSWSAAAGVSFPAPGTSVTLAGPYEYYECSGTCAVTLPVPAAAYQFCVSNAAGGTAAITLAAIGGAAMYEKPDHSAYGTAGTGTFVSTAGTFASVCLVGRDATHYRVSGTPIGVWTAN